MINDVILEGNKSHLTYYEFDLKCKLYFTSP